jgi:hypothetical protein
VIHMNAIISVFEAFFSHKIAEKDYEFSHIFDLSVNLPYKKPILKNYKKVYDATCCPIALKNN